MTEPLSARLRGSVLDGRYRVDAPIGEGGFATVYSGVHLALGAPIAIKVLRYPEGASREHRTEVLSAFVEEARVITRLRHESIVRTLDQGMITEGTDGLPIPYLVMEWCGERSLKAFLEERRGTGLPILDAYRLMLPLVDAAAHAHSLGVAHRDLKPSNVMLFQNERGTFTPRIIDFGIAKLFDSAAAAGSGETLTASMTSAFTPAYAAPEQLAHARTGPWTDVHALALIFVELLAGQPPLGETGSARLAAIDPQRPTPRTFGIDAGPFEQVLEKALSLRPNDRYRNAGELAVALRDAAGRAGDTRSRSVPTSVPSRATSGPNELAPVDAPASKTMRTETEDRPARATSKRRRWPIFAAAAVLLVGGVATAGALAWSRQKPAKKPPKARATASAQAIAGSSSAAPPEERPVTSAAPPARARLADVTLAALEARAKEQGLTIISRLEGDATGHFVQLNYELGVTKGELFCNEVKPPPEMEGPNAVFAALNSVRVWTAGDRERGLELIYGIKDNYVLSMTFPAANPASVEPFEKIAAAFDIDIRGNSHTGPDPATKPEDSRVAWRAKKLDDLVDLELFYRVGTAGTVTSFVQNPGERKIALTTKTAKGDMVEFDAGNALADPIAADKLLTDLRNRKTPFCFMKDGKSTFVSFGPGEFRRPELITSIVAGLPGTVQCEP